MLTQLLPNMLGPIIVIGTLGMGGAILAEAALSFLGLGIRPPYPSWGSMLSEARDQITTAPWLSIFPGPCDLHHRARAQPPRRRPARHPRSRSRGAVRAMTAARGRGPADRPRARATSASHAVQWTCRSRSGAARPSASSANPAAARRITALAIIGLLQRPLGIGGGTIRLDGREHPEPATPTRCAACAASASR